MSAPIRRPSPSATVRRSCRAQYGANWLTEAGYSGHFNNAGEEVALTAPDGGVIQDFTYSNSWYPQTDGGGFSLVVRSTTQSLSLWSSSLGWEPSGTLNGTPGTAETTVIPLPDSIVVEEAMSHASAAPGDMIEFYNTTSQPINIGGWFVSDSSSNLMKYEIAAGTVIAALGYYVLTEDNNFGALANDPGCLVPFGLNANGDDVYLSNSYGGQPGGYREHQTIPAMPAGAAYGIYTKSDGTTNFTLLQAPSFGTLSGTTYSGAAPGIPYVSPLVTDEIMYNPLQPTAAEAAAGYVDSDFEYAEVYNRSSSPVALNDYRVAGGIGYTPGWLPDGSVANDCSVSSITGYPLAGGGETATVIVYNTSTGFQNGDEIHIEGAAQSAYDGDFTIANVTVNTAAGTTTFTYTVSGSPASPATPVTGQALTASKDSEFETLASGATVTWTAAGLAASTYTVYTHLNLYDGENNPLTDLDSQAQYTVTCGGVPTTVTIDQNQVPATLGVTGLTYNSTSGLVTASASNAVVDNDSLTAGSIVHISGATPSQYDGTFVVQSASASGFTYALAGGLDLAAATGTITAGLNDVWISLGTFATSGTVTVELTRTTAASPAEWTVAGGMELVSSQQQTTVMGTPTFGNTNSIPTPPATLLPGQYAVIVSNYAAFEDRYNPTGTNNILVLGVYSGHLNNGGDTVDIDQIGARASGDVAALNGYLPFYRVDHVNYNNAAPWPASPDGNGPALLRARSRLRQRREQLGGQRRGRHARPGRPRLRHVAAHGAHGPGGPGPVKPDIGDQPHLEYVVRPAERRGLLRDLPRWQRDRHVDCGLLCRYDGPSGDELHLYGGGRQPRRLPECPVGGHRRQRTGHHFLGHLLGGQPAHGGLFQRAAAPGHGGWARLLHSDRPQWQRRAAGRCPCPQQHRGDCHHQQRGHRRQQLYAHDDRPDHGIGQPTARHALGLRGL